jgi:hypothetical protein
VENGLQEFIKQNSVIIIGGFISLVSVLLTAIIKLFFKYDKERNARSEERFTAGEKRFEKLEEGQKEIIGKIEKGQERDSTERKRIEDKIGNIGNRLLKIETEHKNNHGE